MLSFENDYSRAAHPAVLEAVAEANNHLYSGYGSDELSDQAKAKIREACGQPDADVWFLVGGTQTNQVVIDTITPAYAGVVAVASGHPNVHEAGAIEFSGHKVLTIPQHNGKMDPTELDEFCKTFYADGNYEHMVFPGSVYVSQSTEYGTIYSKAELQAIADVAHKYDMPLFVDGARLGYALTATGSDMTLADLATIADVFYIGGTKVGALFGDGSFAALRRAMQALLDSEDPANLKAMTAPLLRAVLDNPLCATDPGYAARTVVGVAMTLSAAVAVVVVGLAAPPPGLAVGPWWAVPVIGLIVGVGVAAGTVYYLNRSALPFSEKVPLRPAPSAPASPQTLAVLKVLYTQFCGNPRSKRHDH